jgi:CRP-like cAMP-binding protein
MAGTRRRRNGARGGFDAQVFLETAGLKRRMVSIPARASIFAQGDPAREVFYIKDGSVRLTVLSRTGREAVIATLGPGHFFGEGCLAGQPRRMGAATAITRTAVVAIEKRQMSRTLREQPDLSERFISHVLARNIRIEEDLIDQLFNSSERRLARTLLLLASYGKDDPPVRLIPKVSQEILAEMVGTTRSRVNFFMNKFRRMGFIQYDDRHKGSIRIDKSLLSVVLHD